MATDTPPKPARRRRQWLSFNLRTLMILVTLCALGIFAKLQLDWYRKLWTAREWVETLVDGSVTIESPSLTWPIKSLPACPQPLSDEDQLEVLEIGSIHLKSAAERTAAVKLLVELYPGAARYHLKEVLTTSRDPQIRSLALRLIGLFRNLEDVPIVGRHLDDEDAEVRGAACDALGLIRQPAYQIPFDTQQWPPPSCWVRSTPPIGLDGLIGLVSSGAVAPAGAGTTPPSPRGTRLPNSLKELTPATRAKIERRMTSGATLDEREAAARALVAWPPDDYHLRVAEWGVWINDDGEMKLAQSVIDEIPAFVHRTGNSFDSLKDRINSIMIVTKPIIHLTVDRPLAVDLEVGIAWGRPWFAYPRPDDFSVAVQMLQRPYRMENDQYVEGPLPAWLDQFDNDKIAALDDIREGFPWLYPSHRTAGGIGGVGNPYNQLVTIGLRWQSLVVLPSRQNWMTPPALGGADQRHTWWRRLREVPSSWVSSRGETERFLYYDGPTLAKSPVGAKRVDGVVELSHQTMFPATLLGARAVPAGTPPASRTNWLVQVDGGKITAYVVTTPGKDAGAPVGDDPSDQSPLLRKLNPAELTPLEGDVTERFVETLIGQGLTADEASGLADVWRQQFFETPGQRLLTLLTREDYDALCPLTIRPTPTELIRVGIVLTELPSPAGVGRPQAE